MTSHLPVVIVGGGLVGLTLARELRKHAIRATVLEKAAAPPRFGYTMQVGAGLFEAASLPPSLARPLVRGSSIVHRAALEQYLAAQVSDQLRYNAGVVAVEQVQSPLGDLYHRLTLQNGEQLEARRVIGADGVHSDLRRHYCPSTEKKVLPFVVIRGKRRIARTEAHALFGADWRVSELVNGTLFRCQRDALEESDVVPISWTVSRAALPSSDPLFRPDRSLTEADVVPDTFYDDVAALLPQLKGDALRNLFAPASLREDRKLSWLMRSVTPDVPLLTTLAKEKHVYLLGDALCAEPILGGYGADHGLCDAIAFAHMVAESDWQAAPQWYAQTDWHQRVLESEHRLSTLHTSQ